MNELIVWTLAGDKTFDVSMICLKSFLQYSCQNICLYLLSDGTLTNEQISALENLGNLRVIVPTKEDNEYIEQAISSYSELKQVHPQLVTMKKLIDLPILATEVYSKSSHFSYIDSDIVFIRPFDNLFSSTPTHSLYLEAPDITVSLFDILLINQPHYPFLNSGIIESSKPCFSKSDFLVSKLQDTPRKTGKFTNPHCWEQTVYTYLDTKNPPYFVERKSVYTPCYKENLIATSQRHVAQNTCPFAYHLVRGYKQQIHHFKDIKVDERKYQSNVNISKVKVQPTHTIKSALLKTAIGAQNQLAKVLSNDKN